MFKETRSIQAEPLGYRIHALNLATGSIGHFNDRSADAIVRRAETYRAFLAGETGGEPNTGQAQAAGCAATTAAEARPTAIDVAQWHDTMDALLEHLKLENCDLRRG